MAENLTFEVLPASSAATSAHGNSPSPDQLIILDQLERFARTLDAAITIPGIRLRIGADSVLGLALPGIGDAITAVASGYVVLQGSKLGLPPAKIARMVTNILVDTGIGAIPFAGDVFDIVVKSNLKNVNIIRAHFQMPPLSRR